MRVKIIRDTRMFKKGEILNLPLNEANDLIRSGKAIMSKDLTEIEYEVKHG